MGTDLRLFRPLGNTNPIKRERQSNEMGTCGLIGKSDTHQPEGNISAYKFSSLRNRVSDQRTDKSYELAASSYFPLSPKANAVGLERSF